MKYTLATDFSSLSSAQAGSWVAGFRDMAEGFFSDSDNSRRLLGNLLLMEQYAHTLSHGLSASGKQLSVISLRAFGLLWDALEGKAEPAGFADFANNLYAATLSYNVGESTTEEQEAFYQEHFRDFGQNGYEWRFVTWCSVLLMELVAISGGRLDFDEYEGCGEIDFCEAEEMLNMLADACIELTGTPLPSCKAADWLAAMDQVYQTPLFRQMVRQIQASLQAAHSASPGQYAALRGEYRAYAILPDEYAADLLEI